MKTQEIIKALRSTPSRSKRALLEEAQRAIREICLNSEYKIQDFRIFVEHPAKEGRND